MLVRARLVRRLERARRNARRRDEDDAPLMPGGHVDLADGVEVQFRVIPGGGEELLRQEQVLDEVARRWHRVHCPTDGRDAGPLVAADLITPLWLPRRATNPAGRLCHCAHPEINPLTYSVAVSRGGGDSVAVS